MLGREGVWWHPHLHLLPSPALDACKDPSDGAFTVRHGGDEAGTKRHLNMALTNPNFNPGTKAELYMLPNKTLGFCAVSNSDTFNYDGRGDNGWNTAPIAVVKKWFEKHLPEFAAGTTGIDT